MSNKLVSCFSAGGVAAKVAEKEARLLNNMKVTDAIEKLKISQPVLSA